MTQTEEIIAELEQMGNAATKKVLMNHGAREPFFGVRVGDMKSIVKRIKKNHELSLSLYATGNSDAMYLAGLIADENKITKADLERWADEAYWCYLSEFAVPWVTSETPFAIELGLKWIDSEEERIAAAGWQTLGSYASINPNEKIDIALYSSLIDRIEKDLHGSQNRVRHVMNGFIITIGSYVEPLSQEAMDAAKRIGKVSVEMGGTACKVPFAPDYILKSIDRGTLNKKRKMARC